MIVVLTVVVSVIVFAVAQQRIQMITSFTTSDLREKSKVYQTNTKTTSKNMWQITRSIQIITRSTANSYNNTIPPNTVQQDIPGSASPRIRSREPSFEQWKKQHGKTYSSKGSKTESEAKQIYRTNVAKIVGHNHNPRATYRQGVNSRADMNDAERNAKCKGYKADPNYYMQQSYKSMGDESDQQKFKSTLPSQLDLRPQMSPVKDQGQCGISFASYKFMIILVFSL